MRCRKCGQPAVINMPQHKLALCQEHYVGWITDRTEETIRSYKMFSRDDRILVAVSGGKDSLSLWDILINLGYRADGLYINLGIGEDYSSDSEESARSFAEKHPDVQLIVLNIKERYGMSITELAREKRQGRGRKVCSLCGLVKRHEMNREANDRGYAVIATGHNLDDEAATLFGNLINWKIEYLDHQYPVLEATHENLSRKVRPLCRFYEREMAAYALVRGIAYIRDECPHAVGAKSILYKELLNRLELEMPGVKQRLYLDFLRAKKSGAIQFQLRESVELYACEKCGQPTSAPDRCAFCRLWENDPS